MVIKKLPALFCLAVLLAVGSTSEASAQLEWCRMCDEWVDQSMGVVHAFEGEMPGSGAPYNCDPDTLDVGDSCHAKWYGYCSPEHSQCMTEEATEVLAQAYERQDILVFAALLQHYSHSIGWDRSTNEIVVADCRGAILKKFAFALLPATWARGAPASAH